MKHDDAVSIIQDLLLRICRDSTPCVLCGAATNNGAIFYPNDEFAKKMDTPEDKQRAIVYGICTYCYNKKDSLALTTAQLLKDYKESIQHERN